MKTTKVINLFSGPGVGKSTLAAELFFLMKKRHMDVELVREYIKDWVWDGRKPNKYDQIYILGKQSRKESLFYNKIDYVVTDSPMLLGPFYEQRNIGRSITLPSVLEFIKFAEENGVKYYNYLLERITPFNPKGRYQTEKEAKEIDVELKSWLHTINMPIRNVFVNSEERAGYVLSYLQADGSDFEGKTTDQD